jgi:outer membrane receptor protein involved in Fe transport
MCARPSSDLPRRRWPWGRWRQRPGGISALAVALLVALTCPLDLSAQAGQIAGRVTNAVSGAPIGQVQVYITEASIGTLTRADGRFLLLNVPVGTHDVVAEQIGLGSVTQQVTVGGGETVTVDFQLEAQALGLDEIVVTGTAGASRRREIGNTISQINVDDIANRPTDVNDLLRSSAPGLEIGTTGGEFGQAPAIRLRGNSSLAMSNNPIVYIDGIRVRSEPNAFVAGVDNRGIRGSVVQTSPLSGLNPADIERIEVIKGSAATTLYGTEASAGVIQIFTKSGSRGSPVWSLETQQGAVWSRKFGPSVDDTGPECLRTGVCDFEYMRLDPYLKTGYNANYALSVRGGAESLQYFVSGLWSDEEGFLPNEYGDKRSIRGNFTFRPLGDVQIQWNTAYLSQWQQNVSQSNAQGLTHNVYRGIANYFGDDSYETIAAGVLAFDIQMWVDRFTTGGTITYSPLANLTNRVTIGYDWVQQDARNLRPFGFPSRPRGALLNHHWQNTLLTFDYVGTYSFGITENLRSSFSWGGQAIGDETHQVEAWGEDFPGAAEPTVNSAGFTLGFEERQKVWNAGFFAQNIFDFNDKYFLTLGARVDGNSAFGEGFGLQFYPKASFSWVMSDEAFWPEALGTMRVRAAYGQSGRAPGAFDAVRTWDAAPFANQPAFVPRNLGNPDLGPEITTEIEGGFDASWFDGRMEAVVTYFTATTTDALFQVRQAASEGFGGSQLRNVGELKNSGFEVQLSGSPIQRADWGLDLGLNVSTLKSEVISLGGAPEFTLGGNGWVIEGQPAPVIRARYVTNPDAVADPEVDPDHIYGPNYPTLTLTPSLSVRAPGNVTLTAVGEYKGGSYVTVTNTSSGGVSRGAMMPICWPYYANPGTDTALKADTPALWRARCDATRVDSDYYTFPIDFFRLRTVAASIPVDFLMPERVSNATLTLSLNESYTWKKDFPELDPEMSSNTGGEDTVQSIANRVPMPISFRASLRIQF